MNPAQQLHQAGQGLWLDSISRQLLTSGTLARYINELTVTGLTSNPTILGHAMAAASDYDDSLRRHLAAGVTDPQDLVYAVAMRRVVATPRGSSVRSRLGHPAGRHLSQDHPTVA